jgi:signal transduction histidine kinase
VLAAGGLSPWYLLGGAALAFLVAMVQLQRPTARSVIVATAQRAQAQAVEKLAQSQAMLRSIVDNNMAAIAVRDLHGEVSLENQAWRDLLLEHRMEEVTDWQALQERGRGGPVREELELPGPPPPLVLDVIVFPLHDAEDEVYATCTVALDVSERRRALRALEHSNQELQAFAFVASHDLREPLRTMTAYADVLQRRHADALGDEPLRYVASIRNAGQRGLDLVDDLLRLSRAGTRELDVVPVDLGKVVPQVLEGIEELRAEREATVELATLPVVLADAESVRSLLQNLLVNAIRYVPGDRAPRVTVTSRTADGYARVAIADNGPGIEAAERESIFEMFHRGAAAATTPGSGLGLAICKRIVERHRGQIWVEAGEGGGSVFVFTLPTASLAG